MGQQLTAALTREQLILSVDFQRQDLYARVLYVLFLVCLCLLRDLYRFDTVELLAEIVDGFARRDKEPWGACLFFFYYIDFEKQPTNRIL